MQNNSAVMINKIINDNCLTVNEKYMLIILKLANSDNENNIHISYKEMMESFGTMRKIKISDILKSLKAKGYIDFKRRGRNGNIYTFINTYLINSCNNENIGYEEKSLEEDNTEYYSEFESYKNETFSNTVGYRSESFNNLKSSEGETSDKNKGSENETFSNIVGSGNETLNNFKSFESETYDKSIGSENETFSETIGSRNETFDNIKSSERETVKGVSSSNYGTLNSNIYINNNNKIYINILDHWNSKGIGKSIDLNIKVIDSINKAMSQYSFDEIKKAIDNYSKVYHSDYFYDFQWQLASFLTRDNGIGNFSDNGGIWLKYKKKHYTLRDEYEEWGINIEDYIDGSI